MHFIWEMCLEQVKWHTGCGIKALFNLFDAFKAMFAIKKNE